MRALLLILLCLAISGCGAGRGAKSAEIGQLSNKQEVYRIRPGDILSVQVWGEASLSGDKIVREDGKFTMSLINDVSATGKTTEQVANDVTNELKRFIPGASVAISISQMAPIKYYLLGGFQKPGEYRSSGKITFLQAIATGGGFAPFSDESRMVIIRKAPEGEIRYGLDYNRVVDGADPNPELKDGDVIQVP